MRGTCPHPAAALAIAVGLCLGAPASARADAVLLAAGDIGECTAVGEQGPYLTADLLAMRPEATILALGDLAYSHGRAAEFTNCYGPTWGRFSDRTRSAPGNHEYKTADAEGYFGFWERQAQQPRPAGHSYYSFELGDWHLVALDSSIDVSAGSAQARWLRSDLAGSTARCKLTFSHHPRFSSGWHGDSLEMSAIFQILYDGRVSVMLAGHDHDYERFAPLNPSGEVVPGRGVRSFVVGTGGAPLRALGTPRWGSEARNADAKGVLQLVLRADGYDWTFLPVAGASYSDSGSGMCVPAAEFDPLQYIASHDDLIKAYGADEVAGERHWLSDGQAEGRKADDFNEVQYLENYPDLQVAFGDDTDAATRHYIQAGFFEGRNDVGPE